MRKSAFPSSGTWRVCVGSASICLTASVRLESGMVISRLMRPDIYSIAPNRHSVSASTSSVMVNKSSSNTSLSICTTNTASIAGMLVRMVEEVKVLCATSPCSQARR